MFIQSTVLMAALLFAGQSAIAQTPCETMQTQLNSLNGQLIQAQVDLALAQTLMGYYFDIVTVRTSTYNAAVAAFQANPNQQTWQAMNAADAALDQAHDDHSDAYQAYLAAALAVYNLQAQIATLEQQMQTEGC